MEDGNSMEMERRDQVSTPEIFEAPPPLATPAPTRLTYAPFTTMQTSDCGSDGELAGDNRSLHSVLSSQNMLNGPITTVSIIQAVESMQC